MSRLLLLLIIKEHFPVILYTFTAARFWMPEFYLLTEYFHITGLLILLKGLRTSSHAVFLVSIHTHWMKDEDDEAAGCARGLIVKGSALSEAGAREAVCRCVADFVKSLDAGKDRSEGSRSG